MKIFNAKTQQVEEAEMTVDNNNEIVATFDDGGIVKFPAGLSDDEFQKLVSEHSLANAGQEIITPETEAAAAKEREASMALIGEQPEGDKTDVANEPEQSE